MKAFRILRSSLSESFKGVFRNFSLSLASIFCIAITLVLVGFSIILSYNVNNFTREIEQDMTIVVFLNRKISDEDVKTVGNKIRGLENIKEVKFESKNDVKKSMQEDSEIFNSILEQYNDETNPLQDSYLVKVVDINTIGKIADEIEKIENVDIVKYGEGSVEELVKIFDLVKKIMYGTVVALVLVTIFLIANTIKITIQSRSREIEIRRLVGASNAFIRQPFFFEGIILGFLGSIVPIIGCCFGYRYLYDRLGGQIFTAIIKLVHPSDITFILVLGLLAIGVIVGAFGSYRAVRKYLKI